MQTPIFSIITVTYNAEKVLKRTLESVLSQSYQNIEYLIIDGASTDRTLSLVKKEKENGTSLKKFEIISEEDNGLYDAMNKGLRMATGDYVCFLNAGDTFQTNDCIEKLAVICEQNNMPDIIYGETDITDANGKYLATRRLKAPKKLTWKSFRKGMLVCHQSFITKRNIALEYDLQYKYSSDFDWCIKCMQQAKTITNSHLRLVNYIGEGISTKNRKASLKERYNIMCKYYGTLSTILWHIWFAIRFNWAKLTGNKY